MTALDPCHSLLPLSVLLELQLANLIGVECKGLYHSSLIVKIQRGRSLEVQTKTADVLRRHGFVEESNLLAGKQTQQPFGPSLCN